MKTEKGIMKTVGNHLRGMFFGAVSVLAISTPAFAVNTNLLWLNVTSLSGGVANASLYNATDQVYAVESTTNLSAGWQVETEIWPSNTPVVAPISVQTLDRPKLFLRALDWTGVTNNGNKTPDWWFWENFETLNLSDTTLDTLGYTLYSDYVHQRQPNIIFYTFQLSNFNCYSGSDSGAITIQAGEPFYEAVLVDDTNYSDAVWQPFTTTNFSADLNLGSGFYTVYVGLRGAPANSQQTWMIEQLTLNALNPVIMVTNPVPGTVYQPTIQLEGLVNETLSNLTCSVSNSLGVVRNLQGYWQQAFFDTNLMDFTTNTFE